jgi:hypothetical protein
MFQVSRSGQDLERLSLPVRELLTISSLDFRNQAQTDLKVTSEISPLDLGNVAYLKVHRDSGLRRGVGHAHPGARLEVVKDLLFSLQNEHAQAARGHIEKKTAVCAPGKGEFQECVGGIRFYKCSVLATPVSREGLHGSVPFVFRIS